MAAVAFAAALEATAYRVPYFCAISFDMPHSPSCTSSSSSSRGRNWCCKPCCKLQALTCMRVRVPPRSTFEFPSSCCRRHWSCFPFCILICCLGNLLVVFFFFAALKRGKCCCRNVEKRKGKKEKSKFDKQEITSGILRWNIYTAVNGNVNKSCGYENHIQEKVLASNLPAEMQQQQQQKQRQPQPHVAVADCDKQHICLSTVKLLTVGAKQQ